MNRHAIKNSEAQAAFNVAKYLNLLNNHIKFICITVVIISLIGFVVSYLIPKKYQATSTISIEENIVNDLVEGIAITSSAEAKVRLLEVQLLSRTLLTQVASILDLDLHASTPEEKEKLIANLRSNTFIRHDKSRGFFSVTFRHGNAVMARDFVNTLIRIYVETNTSEKRQESFDATSFLSDQIEIFQDRIQQAQDNIDKYKTEQGIYLSLNEAAVQQKITSADQQLETLRIEKNKLLSQQHMQSDSSQILEELRVKESELRSAKSIYTQKHPIVQRLTLDVEGLRKRAKEIEDTPNTESANAAYRGIQIELKSLEETEKVILAERDKNLKNLESLPAIRTKLSDLEQTKSNEMLIYQKLVGRFGQSEVSKQMELQDKAASFKVIDAAVTPSNHVFPQRYLFMIGSIIAGFGLSFGLIIARSILRTRIYTADDLAIYSIPILAKLPVIIQPEKLRKQQKIDRIAMLITAGVIGIICLAAVVEFLGLPYIERLFPTNVIF